jgi:hypothetical protein
MHGTPVGIHYSTSFRSDVSFLPKHSVNSPRRYYIIAVHYKQLKHLCSGRIELVQVARATLP